MSMRILSAALLCLVVGVSRCSAQEPSLPKAAIDGIESDLIDGCRGTGLLIGVGLRHPVAKALVASAQEHGLVINAPNDETIRLVPALTIGDVEIDEFVELFTAALRTVEDALVLDTTTEAHA